MQFIHNTCMSNCANYLTNIDWSSKRHGQKGRKMPDWGNAANVRLSALPQVAYASTYLASVGLAFHRYCKDVNLCHTVRREADTGLCQRSRFSEQLFHNNNGQFVLIDRI